MEAKQVLEITLSAGHMLLSNGAEAYRVEETIERICSSYNLQCECMVTAKGVFISLLDGDNEKITSLKKIRTRRVDLYRIELINSFSRNLQHNPISYEEAKQILKDIEGAPYFSFPVRIFAASMTSFVYSLFFNGTIYDSIVSAIVSVGIYFMLEKISHVGFFQFFEFFLSGFIIGGVSLAAQKLLPFVSKGNVITGAIMILLPGVPLTNGIKDIIYGDFDSGMTKFGESMLVITAVGAGIGAALAIGVGVKL
ncbi:threonine/serine exporter family protein [Clostridium sp. A1-XYC3]|uniref:Threonine/serine exporter family protein n=1 Tax=Clostridium tanneri TaxID=3037988 RepID=A0ABU4JYA3_9CLOT|nr:threonine/serine exporter family protein [Clostridium sp. A1-XYC3]MDW8803155.1 threonine/serine exporter family protein [Clostridium sp. A1-XYC3]